MTDARRPPYPRSPHRCPRCNAWSPDPWAWKQPHHCQKDNGKEEDNGTRVQPDQADDLE